MDGLPTPICASCYDDIINSETIEFNHAHSFIAALPIWCRICQDRATEGCLVDYGHGEPVICLACSPEFCIGLRALLIVRAGVRCTECHNTVLAAHVAVYNHQNERLITDDL